MVSHSGKKEGILGEPLLNANSLQVLHARYLKKNDKGQVIETPSQMFRRVAKAVASTERKYGKNPKAAEAMFYDALVNLEFLPNSPTLMNAGTKKQMLSACFVLPIYDSLDSIFQTLKDMAKIEQVGGGVGFNFSNLRSEGDIVGSTKGVASGPISFMRIYDMATEVIKQGSRRRGAMMGLLNVDHPDIVNFIRAKQQEGMLNNFNISVAVTDKFMKAAISGQSHLIVDPKTKKPVRKMNAANLFGMIAESAWATGDPGIVFMDEINRNNPTPLIGKITSTNPCSEMPLLPYESCNLGSINLSKLVHEGRIDWPRLRALVHLGVHFLDNVIDANNFPLEEIGHMTLSNRKIGLGVMGFAEMLIQLGIPYDSEEAITTAEGLMRFIRQEAVSKSEELGKLRGSFPNFNKSILCRKYKHMRNATLLSIAPTGTISIIAQTSSSIEPLFALAYVREVLGGALLPEANRLFEDYAKRNAFYSKDLMEEISIKGSLKEIKNVPSQAKRIFVTALDILPEWHVRMQAIFQKYVDNAVSKTINLPSTAKVADVKRAYMMAYKLKCKGITIYRYGSKKQQVLYLGNKPHEKARAHHEYSGGCITGECPF